LRVSGLVVLLLDCSRFGSAMFGFASIE
jgi:hypothetical protein